jgi:hypothetical protein
MSLVRYELSFYIPEDSILHSHCRGNLKSYICSTLFPPALLVHAESAVYIWNALGKWRATYCINSNISFVVLPVPQDVSAHPGVTPCWSLVLWNGVPGPRGRAHESLCLTALSIWTAVKNCLTAMSLLPASLFLPSPTSVLAVSKTLS